MVCSLSFFDLSYRLLMCAHSDYNFVRNGDKCISVGPEPIGPGVCTGNPDQTYMGSSGYRLIPGNTCTKSSGAKDEPVSKKCSQGRRAHIGSHL